MARKSSRLLVIDADVARASGPPQAVHPTSANCRDFLLAVLDICHQIVMTPAIRDEWDHHQSHFARRWRVGMVARNKLRFIPAKEDKVLRARIDSIDLPAKHLAAMQNDCHLIEAAISADQIVVSSDNFVRELFSDAAVQVKELAQIVWVNPCTADDIAIQWLNDGAKSDKHRKLGFAVGNS
jgi:hypothetical protein